MTMHEAEYYSYWL